MVPTEDADAEVLHDVGELDTDGARAGDDHRAGEVLVEDLLLVGHDVLRHLHAGKHAGHGTGRDDELVEGDGALLAGVERDVHRGRAGEGAPAVDLLDLVLLHEEVDALDDAGRHGARALVRRSVGHRRVALDAELRLVVLERVRELGVLDQRLGRDAPDVEADAAPVLGLHDRCLETQLRCADRRDIPTGTGTEDDNIEISHAAILGVCRPLPSRSPTPRADACLERPTSGL